MVAYYSKVHDDCREWCSIAMPTLPSGIEILAELTVFGKNPRVRATGSDVNI
jgi:hypothetical protein